ncbi:DUF2922 domain-containing protein [Aerococcus sanguinicola]|uniref:DUF2922 domain-containing protein n=1 Tax=Aerococcus sanguinicola TaxID=119206 RepID=A0A109RD57_9LACT|nr:MULTISPECIES: DUF2922 domain-containing protein [Aerococcus]AMB93608.1 hypothetical protein AWM72_02000 [Aerococcus sanguinicola]MDK7050828.1 DUF2922 domain-containing protein [Aerococcus sanguinicola]OFT97729.1 hypothetical protein HMPREF3090_00400 [Aerococcus sp. HMSC23C02]PKZ21664.1 DUF2922 domain-containing protein [Aerococcus sanguinicola]
MPEVTQNLELNFKNSLGKSTRISIANPRLDVTAEQAQAAIETIAGAEAFVTPEGTIVYDEAVSARYVTRQVDEVYVAGEEPLA